MPDKIGLMLDLERAKRRIAELENAARPFAAQMDRLNIRDDPDFIWNDNYTGHVPKGITHADWRRIAALLPPEVPRADAI